MAKDFLTLIGMLIIVIGVLAAAYFCTRYLAKAAPNALQGKGKRIVILDQLTVGRDQKILLIQVGTHYLLVGVGGQNISLLLELSHEDIQLSQSPIEDSPNAGRFYNILKGASQKKKE